MVATCRNWWSITPYSTRPPAVTNTRSWWMAGCRSPARKSTSQCACARSIGFGAVSSPPSRRDAGGVKARSGTGRSVRRRPAALGGASPRRRPPASPAAGTSIEVLELLVIAEDKQDVHYIDKPSDEKPRRCGPGLRLMRHPRYDGLQG